MNQLKFKISPRLNRVEDTAYIGYAVLISAVATIGVLIHVEARAAQDNAFALTGMTSTLLILMNGFIVVVLLTVDLPGNSTQNISLSNECARLRKQLRKSERERIRVDAECEELALWLGATIAEFKEHWGGLRDRRPEPGSLRRQRGVIDTAQLETEMQEADAELKSDYKIPVFADGEIQGSWVVKQSLQRKAN